METATSPPTSAGRDFPLGVEGFTYQDLHREERLADLDRAFLEELRREDAPLAARLAAYRANPAALDPLSLSRLLVDAARPLARFVARLFGIEEEWRRQAADAGPEAVLFRFRRDFVLRRAVKAKLPEDLSAAALSPLEDAARALERELHPGLPWQEDAELATSKMATALLDLESEFLAAVREGEQQADQGKLIPLEQVEKNLPSWLSKSS